MKIAISPLLLDFAAQYAPEKVFTGSAALETKRTHVENVISITQRLQQTSVNPVYQSLDSDLLKLCAEMHDIGRVDQYRILGKFWDSQLNHTVLGAKCFDEYIAFHSNFEHNKTEIESACFKIQSQILRDVILFHGKPDDCANPASRPYVLLITAADDIENASACISYLIREVQEDAKGYIHNNPEANQRELSNPDFIFSCYENGIKFDKSKYCKTYADYVIFAATLMTSSCKQYMFASSMLNVPGYGYSTVLEGYKHVFEETLSPELASKAYSVLQLYSKMK